MAHSSTHSSCRGAEWREVAGAGHRAGCDSPGLPARLSTSPGTWEREAQRGWRWSPAQAEGWPSCTPGCLPPVPRAPPCPSRSQGWGRRFPMGLGGRWRRRGYETSGCFLTRGPGGPRAHLEPRHCPALQVRLHVAWVQVGDAHEEAGTSESPEFPKAETGLGQGSRSERGALIQNQCLPAALPMPFCPVLGSPVPGAFHTQKTFLPPALGKNGCPPAPLP